MNTQVSFTLPAEVKNAFSQRAKEKWISMKALYLAFSQKFASWSLDFDFNFFDKKEDNLVIESIEGLKWSEDFIWSDLHKKSLDIFEKIENWRIRPKKITKI